MHPVCIKVFLIVGDMVMICRDGKEYREGYLYRFRTPIIESLMVDVNEGTLQIQINEVHLV